MRANRLVWPVTGPGGRRYYLTGAQRALLWTVRRQVHRGPSTLEALTALNGGSSRGRTWHQLSRLRQLGLVGWRSWAPNDKRRGQHARLLLWIPAAARAAYRGSRRAAGVGNDSVSTPYRGFITGAGVTRAHGEWPPPSLAAGPPRPVVPRRGIDPPRVLYARCPAGHRTTIGRRSLTRDPAQLVVEWSGHCRTCRRPVVERLQLALRAVPPRPPSPAELEDPELAARRRRAAAELLAAGSLPAGVREQLTRDYTGPAPERVTPLQRPP